MSFQDTSSFNRGRAYRRRLVVAVSLGNSLEWFDFVIFGFFAAQIARVLFPAADPTTSLLFVFSTFGITFLFRPVGAILLGSLADRRGRKSTLVLVIGLMTVGSALLAIAPPYATIGIWAPILVVIARILQGLSAGGEFGAVTALLAEQDPERRGYYASWQFASQGLTTMMATGCGLALSQLLTPQALEEWGWRIPFAIGVLIGPVGYYVRARLAESPEFSAVRSLPAPVLTLASQGRRQVLLCAGIVAAAASVVYLILYLPAYAATNLGLAATESFAGGFAAGAVQVVLIPLIGWLSDRSGRLVIAGSAAAAILLLTYPLFLLLAAAPAPSTLFAIQVVIGVLSAVYLGGIAGIIAELFPATTRTSGLAVGHALGVTVFGGFAPLACTALIAFTGSSLAPSFYVMATAAVSLACLALSGQSLVVGAEARR